MIVVLINNIYVIKKNLINNNSLHFESIIHDINILNVNFKVQISFKYLINLGILS